ncbi:MAG: hypothetical protein WCW13_04705 [archaeon]|jgi:hypothetical protein
MTEDKNEKKKRFELLNKQERDVLHQKKVSSQEIGACVSRLQEKYAQIDLIVPEFFQDLRLLISNFGYIKPKEVELFAQKEEALRKLLPKEIAMTSMNLELPFKEISIEFSTLVTQFEQTLKDPNLILIDKEKLLEEILQDNLKRDMAIIESHLSKDMNAEEKKFIILLGKLFERTRRNEFIVNDLGAHVIGTDENEVCELKFQYSKSSEELLKLINACENLSLIWVNENTSKACYKVCLLYPGILAALAFDKQFNFRSADLSAFEQLIYGGVYSRARQKYPASFALDKFNLL